MPPKLTALGGKFYFLKHLMLSADFAILPILKLTRNKFFILATVIHSALAHRTLQFD